MSLTLWLPQINQCVQLPPYLSIQANPLEPWNPAIRQATKVGPSQQGSNVGGEYHAIGWSRPCGGNPVEPFSGMFFLSKFFGAFWKKKTMEIHHDFPKNWASDLFSGEVSISCFSSKGLKHPT